MQSNVRFVRLVRRRHHVSVRNVLLRWWRVRDRLRAPCINNGLSAALSIVGFGASFVLSKVIAGPVGVVLGAVAFLAGSVYLIDIVVRQLVMRRSTHFDAGPRPEHFTNVPTELESTYRFVSPSDTSLAQLYPYVDFSHHEPGIRHANDLTVAERLDLYARWYRLCSAGFMHLEKLDGDAWRPIAISIVFPLTPHGFSAITRGHKKHQSRVVDLDAGGVSARLDRRHRVLMIDTWIVDKPHRGSGHGRTETSGGFANALVLRHIAQFWNSANRFPQTTFFVETSNRDLELLLHALNFRSGGRSKIDASFFQSEKSTLAAVAGPEFKRIKDAVTALAGVPVTSGTVAVPVDWRECFPDSGAAAFTLARPIPDGALGD